MKILCKRGMGTVEMIVLVAILVGLALIFKGFILEFVQELMEDLNRVNIDPNNLSGVFYVL